MGVHESSGDVLRGALGEQASGERPVLLVRLNRRQ